MVYSLNVIYDFNWRSAQIEIILNCTEIYTPWHVKQIQFLLNHSSSLHFWLLTNVNPLHLCFLSIWMGQCSIYSNLTLLPGQCDFFFSFFINGRSVKTGVLLEIILHKVLVSLSKKSANWSSFTTELVYK